MNEFETNELTLLAIMIYSCGINKEFYNRIFNYIPSKMFSNKKLEYIYIMLKELAKSRESLIIGNPSHVSQYLIQKSIIDYPNKNIEQIIISLEQYWLAQSTIDHWIKHIQEEYFNYCFKAAKNQKEYEEILKEKKKLQITDVIENIGCNAEKALEEYDKRLSASVFTPYKNLNEKIGSLQGGDMIILAGASSSGKTCFALNLISGMAEQGKKVLVFSLEMPKYQLQQRLASKYLKLDSNKFRNFTLNLTEKLEYSEFMNNKLSKLPIWIYKHQTASIETIKSLVANSKADIVIIDYLGLINSYSAKSSYEKFSDISREIKLLAMSVNKPIIALHQLNRSFADREDKRPKVSDLRDSGKIEQDSDMIWLVYRPAQFNVQSNINDMRLIIGKNRSGESGIELCFNFDGKYQEIKEGAVNGYN